MDFYPRSPRGERPLGLNFGLCLFQISIHAPREGSDGFSGRWVAEHQDISIHAPREGSDARPSSGRNKHEYFYPRSPRGERRSRITRQRSAARFLSTLPARGATRDTAKQLGVSQFLSTLPARGATALGLNFGPCFRQFLSTLPARGATGRRAGLLPAPPISIHAPREGSDGCSRLLLPRPTDFYPRSPRGERQQGPGGLLHLPISIHAPREGSDHRPVVDL